MHISPYISHIRQNVLNSFHIVRRILSLDLLLHTAHHPWDFQWTRPVQDGLSITWNTTAGANKDNGNDIKNNQRAGASFFIEGERGKSLLQFLLLAVFMWTLVDTLYSLYSCCFLFVFLFFIFKL